jgi:hypothetical protein
VILRARAGTDWRAARFLLMDEKTSSEQKPPEPPMSPADRYRVLAAHLRSRAAHETSSALRSQWAHLAQCYVRLAEQADQNSRADIVYEFDRSHRRGGEPA